MGLAHPNGGRDKRPGSRRPKGSRRAKTQAGDASGGSSSPSKGALRFTIPSTFARGHEVQQAILDAMQEAGFTANSCFAVKLALDEAMVNAIKHGNGLDAEKVVKVEADVKPDRVDISIEDQGKGFSRDNVPDPTHDDNLHRPSGRGILLIESYMNRAIWDRGGRRLRMVRCNEEDELPTRELAE